MGTIVLHNAPKPRESVSVQLLKSIQQERRLRRNPPEPRSWMIDRTDLPRKSQDMDRPVIKQGDVSSYSATEVIPVFQYEPVEAKEPQVSRRMAYRRNSLAVPKMDISKPLANNTMTHNPQGSVLKIYEQLSNLSSPRHSSFPTDRKSSDSAILKDFLRMVSGKIEKSKRYPGWAMDAGLEGKVVVRFTILQNGALGEHLQLVKSSGTEILDNAAMAAVRDAAPFPVLPNSLSREQLQVELPMDFRLRES